MSTTIDNKVVEMSFDNQNFESNAQQSISTLDKLKQALKFGNAEKSFNDIEEASKNVTFSDLKDSIDALNDKFTASAEFIRAKIEGVFDSLWNKGTALVKGLSVDQISAGWGKFADKTTAVQTIMSATSQTWKEDAKSLGLVGTQMEYVDEQLNKLNWFTDETSYSFTDMTSNIGKFTSAGVKLSDAVTAMEGISTWAAKSGQGVNEASRAMYNLSQALGSGVIRLQDWKSVENANMATLEFKQTVIDTAVELGAISKGEVTAEAFSASLENKWFTSDVLMATLEKYGKAATKLSDISAEYGTTASQFLSGMEAWKKGTKTIDDISSDLGITVEELLPMFEELNSKEYELGLASFKMAQEAKTFQEAIDATKDAVSTGWMTTFETIFGNYEEAKVLWTDLANALWDVFAASGETRNEILALWKEDGGRDDLIDAFWNLWDAIGSISAPIKEAFGNIFPSTIQDSADKLIEFTFELKMFNERLKLSEEEANTLRSVFEALFSILKPFKQLLGSVDGVFTLLTYDSAEYHAGLRDIVVGISGLVTEFNRIIDETSIIRKILIPTAELIRKAFYNIFPPKTEQQIESAMDTISKISDKLKNLEKILTDFRLSPDIQEGLLKVFKGFFSILDIGKTALYAIIDGIQAIFTYFDGNTFSNVVTYISNIVVSASEFVTILADVIKKTRVFNAIMSDVVSFIVSIPRYIDEIFTAITGTSLVDVFESIGNAIQNAFSGDTREAIEEGIDNFYSFRDRFKKTASEVYQFLLDTLTNIRETVVDAIDVIKNVIDKIVPYITPIFEKLKDILLGLKDSISGALSSSRESFEEFGEMDTSGLEKFKDRIEKIFSPLVKLFDGLKSVFEAIWEVLKKLGPIFAELFGIIGDMLGKLGITLKENIEDASFDDILDLVNGGVLVAIGAGLAKFTNGLGDIVKDGANIAEKLKGILGSVRECFELYQQKIKAETLKTIATAILMITASVVVLSLIDSGKLTASLTALGAEMGELIAAMKLISKIDSKNLVKTSAALIEFSFAVLLITAACKSLSSLEAGELLTGLIGVFALSEIMVLIAKQMSKIEKISKNMFSMIEFAIAIKLMVKPVQELGAMNFNSMLKGLIGVFAISEIMVLIAKQMSKIKKISSNMLSLIEFAIAIKMLVEPVQELGAMDFESMVKGLLGVGALFAEMSLFLNNSDFKKMGVNTGLGILLVAEAMKVMGDAIDRMGSLSLETIAKGLGAMAVVLLELGIAFKGMSSSKHIVSSSEALLIAAVAMDALIPALMIFGNMSLPELGKGLLAVGGALAEFAIALNLMKGTIGASAALLIAALAIDLLVPGLLILGNMGWENILKSLVALGGALAILGVAGALLAPITPAILALAAAMALFGVGVLAVSVGILALEVAITGFLAMGTAGMALIKQLIKELITLLPDIAVALAESIVALVKVIGDAFPIIAKAITKIVSSTISSVLEILTNTIPDFMTFLETLVTSILDFLINTMPKFMEWFGSLISGFVGLLADVIPQLSSVISALLNVIIENSPLFMEAIGTLIMDLLTTLRDIIPEAVRVLGEMISAMIIELGNQVGNVIDAVFKFVVNVINGFADALVENAPLVRDAIWHLITSVFEAIKILLGFDGSGHFGKVVSTVLDFIASIVKGLWDGLVNIVTALGEIIQKVISAGYEKIKSFGKMGVEFITGIISGFWEKLVDLKNAAGDIISKAWQAVKDKVSEWVQIGKDLIQGFIDGVKSMFEKVKNAVKEVVSGAVDKIKGFLGIESPSKLFRSFGQYVDEGFILGVEDEVEEVGDAVEEMGEVAVDAMKDTMKNLAEEITDNVDATPVIAPVVDLTNFNAGIHRMNSSLDGMSSLNISAGFKGVHDIQNGMNSTSNSDESVGKSGVNGSTYTFTQNNYSPKALSRTEIYRQTRNQFSQWKGLVNQ